MPSTRRRAPCSTRPSILVRGRAAGNNGNEMRLCAAALLLLSGCASVVDRHHFATVDAQTGEIINIFRVTVRGDAQLANARYISGYYDQRAVDLFFNQVRSTPLPADLQSSVVEP